MTENKPTLDCIDPEIGALLMSYGLGTLTDAEEEKFELHLLHCPACQQEIETASLSLNALSETREQFVLHAHQEDEDFESQYERLERDTRTVSDEVKTDRSRGWLESFWEAVWGRRWIIGTAGAVAIAMVFVLREGPRLTQPSVVKDESVSMHYVLSPPKAGVKADTSAVKNQPVQVGIAETQEAEEPRILTQPIGEKKEAITLKAKAAEPRQVEQSPGVIAQQEVVTERIPDLVGDAEEEEEAIIGQEMVVQYDAVTGVSTSEKLDADSNRVEEYSRFAEIALGRFEPDRYLSLSAADVEASPEAFLELPHSATTRSGRGKENDALNADTLFVRHRYTEARDRYELKGKRDTTDASPHMMAGVASFALGDYAGAKASLETAYNLLSEGTQSNEVGLLLARVDIMTGQFEEAKDLLQNVAATESDSVRKALVQSAIAKVDSFINSEVLKQAPPK